MAEADRISFLPLEIKISILSGLQIKDAIRTSAVARSWRHLWTLLPCLRLSYVQDSLGIDSDEDTTSVRWIQRVHHLVSSLRGPLVDLELIHSGFLLDSFFRDDLSALFQSLLDLLLRKGGLETLYLRIGVPRVVIRLPSFPSLKVLELYGCHVILPAGFCGFNRLTTLALRLVKISNDDLNLLINTSNNLTTWVKLDCESSEDPLSVNLSFPLIRHLEFDINDSVEEVLVIYAPCLEEAHFTLGPRDCRSEKLARVTLGLVTSVARVSSLKLYFDVLKNFSLAALPFNFTFPRLKCLNFFLNINTMDKRMYDAFVWLLRSMPFLEELEIELMNDDSSQTKRVAVLMRELLVKKHDGFACLDQTLRSVTIRMGKLDVIASIAMIQFFLLNANVLKLLKVVYSIAANEDVLSMIEELQSALVTSSDAKVVIFDRLCKSNVYVR